MLKRDSSAESLSTIWRELKFGLIASNTELLVFPNGLPHL